MRRRLATLFADIAGSTRLVVHHEPETVLGVFQCFAELVSDIALAHHGHVKDFEGDGVLLYFDSAVDAAEAALAIRAALDREHDRILASAWRLEAYKKNPAVLWGHDYTMPPIAVCREISVSGGALRTVLLDFGRPLLRRRVTIRRRSSRSPSTPEIDQVQVVESAMPAVLRRPLKCGAPCARVVE